MSWVLFPGEWLRSSVVWVVGAVSLCALALARGGRVSTASWALVAMVWAVFSYALVVAGPSLPLGSLRRSRLEGLRRHGLDLLASLECILGD